MAVSSQALLLFAFIFVAAAEVGSQQWQITRAHAHADEPEYRCLFLIYIGG